MTLRELVIYLLVTGSLGAVVGGGIGWFHGRTSGGAGVGALFGPVVAGTIITIIVWCCNLREKLKDKK